MRSKSNSIKLKGSGNHTLSDSKDEFMAEKAKRKAEFINQSKGIPSSQANNNATLISNLNPLDMKILNSLNSLSAVTSNPL